MNDSSFAKLCSRLKPEWVRNVEDLRAFVWKFAEAVIRQPSHEKAHFEIDSEDVPLVVRGYLPYPATRAAFEKILERVPLQSVQTSVSAMDPNPEENGFLRCLNLIHGMEHPVEKSDCAHIWEPGDPIKVLRMDRGHWLCQAGDGYLAWTDPLEMTGTLEEKSKVEYAPASPLMTFLEWPEIIAEWEGVPYVWGGIGKQGVDCSGLVMRLYQAAGYQIPRDSHQQMLIGRLIEKDPGSGGFCGGDLLFFTHEDGRIGHVAISIGGHRVLHAQEGGVCTFSLDPNEEDFDPYRAKHFVFAKRLLEPYKWMR